MFLIQIGGLGFMTIATLFALLLGRRIGLKERILLKESLNKANVSGVVRLVKVVVLITVTVELVAATFLSIYWASSMGWKQASYYGLFHSVSAFNNAGFDLFGTISGQFSGLTSFATDPVVSLIIAMVFIIGGLGFAVLIDIYHSKKFSKLSLHSKIVLSSTGVLVLVGFFGVLILEFSSEDTLAQLSLSGKIIVAFFQGVTPRTAGFNTIDLGLFHSSTIFLIILLMFIGASPGSTGGGIKNATFVALFALVRSTLKGKNEVVLYNKKIPFDILNKAITVTVLAMAWIFVVTMILSITEGTDFLTNLFEATSAFSTVGLSLGLTPKLSILGQIIIMITMFIGRLGPLTLGYLLVLNKKESKISHPEERILIG